MASTSYRYSQLPTDEFPKNLGDRKLPVRVWVLLGLLVVVVVGLSVAVGVLAAKANSPACKDGLLAEQECRNINHLLEQELTQVQAQAATCNQTVRERKGESKRNIDCCSTHGCIHRLILSMCPDQETLKISLKEEKAGGHKQQELVQKLQEEIKTLNRSLQNKSSELEKKSAELEQLRKENEALVFGKSPPNSGITLHLSVATLLLSLSLLALLA